MEIEIHGFVAVVHNINIDEIKKLTNNILHIDYEQYSKNDFEDKLAIQYSFAGKGESVSIRSGSTKVQGAYGYVKINLHGSFFDNSPEFKLDELISYISHFKYTPKQLDVAFNDTCNCLSIEEVTRWCNRPKEYCIGSLVKRDAPGIRSKNDNLDRIELESASSKTNYGTIYVRPDTGHIRFEIKFRNKDKIHYLLANYCTQNCHQFEARSLEALVGCINFIKPSSRGKRGKAQNIKQPSWKKFLQADINKMNWSKQKKEKAKNRFVADNYKKNKSIKSLVAVFQNMVKKASLLMPEDEVLNQLSEYSGYIVMRSKAVTGTYHN